MPDLNNLTIIQVVSLAIVIAVIDTLAAIALSITQVKFSLGAVAIWLQSHVLRRVFPILALAAIGHGLVFVCGGYFKPALWAIRPEGRGDVTGSHVAWRMEQASTLSTT